MAVNATSSLTGLGGVGPIATGGRGVRPLDSSIADENPLVVDNGTGSEATSAASGRADANPSSFAVGSFAAQPEYQAAVVAGTAPSPRSVAAAYQAAAAEGAAALSAEVQIPGLPQRLSSGRLLDLSV